MGLARGGRVSFRALNIDSDRRLNELKGKVHLAAGFNAELFVRALVS